VTLLHPISFKTLTVPVEESGPYVTNTLFLGCTLPTTQNGISVPQPFFKTDFIDLLHLPFTAFQRYWPTHKPNRFTTTVRCCKQYAMRVCRI